MSALQGRVLVHAVIKLFVRNCIYCLLGNEYGFVNIYKKANVMAPLSMRCIQQVVGPI